MNNCNRHEVFERSDDIDNDTTNNNNNTSELTELENNNEPILILIKDLIIKERNMLNEKNNEFIMDIIKDLLEKERNTYNKQMALLKTEVIKHKELNKRLLRNKVTTSSFSDSMYENENINSINDQHQQQKQQQEQQQQLLLQQQRQQKRKQQRQQQRQQQQQKQQQEQQQEKQQQQQQQQPVTNDILVQIKSMQNDMKLLWDDNKHLNEKVVLLDHQVNQKRSPSSTSIEELNSVVNKQDGHDELSLNVLTYMMLGFGLHLKQRKLLKQLDEDIAPWERYSTGFPSKMLQKYRYNGGGLGKTGNGIVNPISIKKLHGSGVIVKESNTEEAGNTKLLNPPNRVKNVVKPWPPNTTLIIGDSILWGCRRGPVKEIQCQSSCKPWSASGRFIRLYGSTTKKKTPKYHLAHRFQ